MDEEYSEAHQSMETTDSCVVLPQQQESFVVLNHENLRDTPSPPQQPHTSLSVSSSDRSSSSSLSSEKILHMQQVIVQNQILEDELRQITHEMEVATTDLGQVKADKEELQKEVAGLKEKLSQLHNEKQQLSQITSGSGSETMILNLNEKVEHLTATVTGLENSMRALQNENTELKAMNMQLNVAQQNDAFAFVLNPDEDGAEKTPELKDLIQILDEERKETQKFKQQAEDLTRQVADSREVQTQIEHRYTEAVKKINALQDEIEQSEVVGRQKAEADEAARRCLKLQTEKQNVDINKLKIDLETERLRVHESTEAYKKLQNHVKSLESRQVSERSAERRSEADSLTVRLMQADEHRHRQEEIIKQLRLEIVGKDETLASIPALQYQIEANKQDFESERRSNADLKAENEQLRKELLCQKSSQIDMMSVPDAMASAFSLSSSSDPNFQPRGSFDVVDVPGAPQQPAILQCPLCHEVQSSVEALQQHADLCCAKASITNAGFMMESA